MRQRSVSIAWVCSENGYDSDERSRRLVFGFIVLLLLCFVFGKIQLKRESQLLKDLHNGITVRTVAMAGVEVTSIT